VQYASTRREIPILFLANAIKIYADEKKKDEIKKLMMTSERINLGNLLSRNFLF